MSDRDALIRIFKLALGYEPGPRADLLVSDDPVVLDKVVQDVIAKFEHIEDAPQAAILRRFAPDHADRFIAAAASVGATMRAVDEVLRLPPSEASRVAAQEARQAMDDAGAAFDKVVYEALAALGWRAH